MIDDVKEILQKLFPNCVNQVSVKSGNVTAVINLNNKSEAKKFDENRQLAEKQILKLKDCKTAAVILTFESQSSGTENVKKIIAVASGKGGVGKSTTSVNLACALQMQGYKVGLLDADIYGPSSPRMMGTIERPESPDGKIIIPASVLGGIKLMSIGLMVKEDTPMIWRGPMLQSALTQLLEKTMWGELDYIIVDMPPGTGDVQLTLCQKTKLAGAVIVSTPQEIALIEAYKAIAMFSKFSVPILGMIENMSYFICPNCDEKHNIFPSGGAKIAAKNYKVPYLGDMPITTSIVSTSEEGKPIIQSHPDSIFAQNYIKIANTIVNALQD